jgi:hypothetical protein
MLVYFRDKLRHCGKTSFSKRELSQILSIYGARVQSGVWKDYAIDNLPDMAIFSIFRSSHEQPLYTVVKISSNSMIKPSQYAVYSGKQALKQSTSLREVLDFLEEKA